MASDQEIYPLNQNLLRLLTEKVSEKRKSGAWEVERMMKDYVSTNNLNMIQKLLKVLAQDLALSENGNYRKGGLIGLAAASIALGSTHIRNYVPFIVKPVLACFNDSDSRIRYFASEALYNITKVARGHILPHFPDIFDVLSKLCADSDTNTKNGAELLDRLVKDVVIESKTFDLETFVPLLRERIYARNPFVRQFLVSWVSVLHSVPGIDILKYLPDFLDGLLTILSDPRLEIRKATEHVLGEFLHGIVSAPEHVAYSSMINILIAHAQSQDDLVQFTAILWIKHFIKMSGVQMLPFASGILTAILPCLSYESEGRKNARENAKQVNQELSKLVPKEVSPDLNKMSKDILTLDLESIIEVLILNLRHDAVPTRLAGLRWVYNLFDETPRRTFQSIDKLFPVLMNMIEDSSDEVVLATLEVYAQISSVSDQLQILFVPSDSTTPISYFRRFIRELLDVFKRDRQLLDDRSHFIIRQLCLLLSAEEIYTVIADILNVEPDAKFASVMVKTLNNILLTASELFELRTSLREFSTETSIQLFVKLYSCWSHNSIATVALCFLTKQYMHASDILQVIGDLDVTVEVLIEIDRLIQLIESPIFTHLRMQLLDPVKNADLVRALYGLLMLLPQSEAFSTLQRRLQCIPHGSQLMTSPNSSTKPRQQDVTVPNLGDLLQSFRKVQLSQQISARKARRANDVT